MIASRVLLLNLSIGGHMKNRAACFKTALFFAIVPSGMVLNSSSTFIEEFAGIFTAKARQSSQFS